ncbi:DNA repair protein RecO [uncultured Bifidobacterium sp.]|uniref:DNA repair protein RecO n=1 Tax=uncultured Bifidobacterium sp. TaxID=165187 RepID=UPI0026342499|nr:DNA repair protein RecO [uncultured Bifidobacterium sp.]
MPLYRDEAVVLRTVKLGEADRIVTLLTRDHGKVRAVAKGVRRTKSRFGGRLEPFMRSDLLIATGRSLDVISQAVSVGAYAGPIGADYDAFSAANVVAETADRVVAAEKEPAEHQYRLLIGALASLARHAHPSDDIALSYVLRSLAMAGWMPRLDSCVVCGRRVAGGADGGAHATGGDLWLSMDAGGVMCAADHTPDSRRVSTVALLRVSALLRGDWKVVEAGDGDAAIVADAARVVEEWSAYYLERPIRSLRWVDS